MINITSLPIIVRSVLPASVPSSQMDDPFDGVAEVLRQHCHQPDIEGARALYAAVAAHRLSGPPVWAMIVAPPGSFKTELLNPLEDLAGVHFVDKVTPNTFLSGQIDDGKKKREVSPSLLHRIGPNGLIICPDFSTVISMHRDNRGSILADLRRIFDGHLKKEFGTADNPQDREWRGRITFLAAATPEIDRHYSIFQSLGERFVLIRWHRPGGVEAAEIAIRQNAQEVKQTLKAAVHTLLAKPVTVAPQLAKADEHRIAALGEIAVRGRTHVPRDGYRKEIIYVPEAEANTRLPQQLAQLAKGSAFLSGRAVVGEQDMTLVTRVAFDCIPAARRAILSALIRKKGLEEAKLPTSTLSYAKEELQTQDLMRADILSPLVCDLLAKAGIVL